MKKKTIKIELSEADYHFLEEIADACSWPIEEVVVQCIRSGMPPSLSKVPEEFHAELLPLNALDDKDLLKIVDGNWPKPKKLDELHKKANFLSLRRTYALSLLKWRGHPTDPYEAWFG
jgi:hypothetical protein